MNQRQRLAHQGRDCTTDRESCQRNWCIELTDERAVNPADTAALVARMKSEERMVTTWGINDAPALAKSLSSVSEVVNALRLRFERRDEEPARKNIAGRGVS